MKLADHQSGGQEHLLLSVVLAIGPDGRVDFNFRPEILQHVILGREIEPDGSSKHAPVAGGYSHSCCTLQVEVSPAFTQSQWGLYRRTGRAIRMTAWGNRGRQHRCHYVVAVFGIAGRSPILEQEGHVTDAVIESGLGVGEVGWSAH